MGPSEQDKDSETKRKAIIMCTGIRFSDSEGNMYLARNLDWSTRYGERVVITPKGFPLPYSFLDDAPARYAVIGMAVALHNYPLYFDCGNEAGLGVAGLNFPGFAEYSAEPCAGKTNIAAFEFPIWVAANFATVDEAEAALRNANIVAKPAGEHFGVSMLHWIIGDGKRSIVVEQMEDGLHVIDDPVDTLANQPEFTWHLTNLRTYITANGGFPANATWNRAELAPFGAGAGARGIPGDSYSPSRFVKAAFLNANYPEKSTEKENVLRAFHTLSNVAMVEGSAAMADGTFERTLYTGCFSARTKSYYYSTDDDPSIRCVKLDDFAGCDASELICA